MRSYWVHEIESIRKIVDIADMEVVMEFSDVYPDELPSLPPPWEVKFRFDLIPDATSVAKVSYQLDPSEMEMWSQL